MAPSLLQAQVSETIDNAAPAAGSVNDLTVTGKNTPDDEEFDLTLDFKPTARALRGSWFRRRYGSIKPGKSHEHYNIRATLNWPLDLI